MANGGLQYYLARLNIAEKLIAMNLAIFILTGLASALLGFSTDSILYWFELPKDFFSFLTRPWSLVTYSFFHAGIGHIFWNMLILYFTGRIFLNLFDNQRFINVYFLGVILGGLLFLASYNIFPTLLNTNTSLIGASAGVTAVLIFICTYIPNQEVRLFGLINLKLWYLGAFVVLVDLIRIASGENIGGRLAHLGGASLGYFYARQLLNGRDMGQGFSKVLTSMGNLFKSGKGKAPLRTVHRKNKTKGAKSGIDYNKETRQKKIDAILDKISKSGYESLSKAEKDFLFKAGKEE
ncbi:MAG: rhomboid family intramembrane serine protease [Bacteroidota bacterium]